MGGCAALSEVEVSFNPKEFGAGGCAATLFLFLLPIGLYITKSL